MLQKPLFTTLASLLAVLSISPTIVPAQRPTSQQQPNSQQRPGQQRGGQQTPAVGTELPTVSAFDQQGERFSTASLKGSYTVLVFGCLT